MQNWPKSALKFHLNNEKYFSRTSKERDKTKYLSVQKRFGTYTYLKWLHDAMADTAFLRWFSLMRHHLLSLLTSKKYMYGNSLLIWYDNEIFQGQTTISPSARLSNNAPTWAGVVYQIEGPLIPSRNNGCWSRPCSNQHTMKVATWDERGQILSDNTWYTTACIS